jgi:hypothetical protein
LTPATDFFLAFGKVSDPLQALANEGAEIARDGHGLGQQVAFIGPDSAALRLNSPGWLKVAPELIAALSKREDLRLLCRDRLESIIPPFAAQTRRWIGSYLDRVEGLAGDTRDHGNLLTRPSDRYFAALLPLPSPHIVAAYRANGKVSIDDDAEFVHLDIAFWDGVQLTGVIFGDENASTPEEHKALNRLAERAQSRFVLKRIALNKISDAFAQTQANKILDANQPWYGPYRASEFSKPLP